MSIHAALHVNMFVNSEKHNYVEYWITTLQLYSILQKKLGASDGSLGRYPDGLREVCGSNSVADNLLVGSHLTNPTADLKGPCQPVPVTAEVKITLHLDIGLITRIPKDQFSPGHARYGPKSRSCRSLFFLVSTTADRLHEMAIATVSCIHLGLGFAKENKKHRKITMP